MVRAACGGENLMGTARAVRAAEGGTNDELSDECHLKIITSFQTD
jgi:hypothetical protein